jgi:hypothetical protein
MAAFRALQHPVWHWRVSPVLSGDGQQTGSTARQLSVSLAHFRPRDHTLLAVAPIWFRQDWIFRFTSMLLMSSRISLSRRIRS